MDIHIKYTRGLNFNCHRYWLCQSLFVGTGSEELQPSPTRYCWFMQTSCLVGDFGLGNRRHRGEWRWGPSLMLFGLMALLVAIGPVVIGKNRKTTLGLSE